MDNNEVVTEEVAGASKDMLCVIRDRQSVQKAL